MIYNDRQVAFREAGHAIAAYRLLPRCSQGPIAICPDANGRSVGSDFLKGIYLGDESEEQWGQTIFLLSGYAACVAAGWTEDESKGSSQDDFEKAIGIIKAHGSCCLGSYIREALAFMRRDDNIEAVAAVANELLQHRTLTAEEQYALIEMVDGLVTDEDHSLASAWG